MITRLLPQQVSKHWDFVKAGILDIGVKYFPGNWELSNNIFQRCLAGTIQVWLCYDLEKENPVFKGFYLTSIEFDNLDGGRTLVLMIVYLYKQPSPELFQEGKAAIEDFARANSCKNITIITPPGHRDKLVSSLWGEAEKKTLFVIPVR